MTNSFFDSNSSLAYFAHNGCSLLCGFYSSQLMCLLYRITCESLFPLHFGYVRTKALIFPINVAQMDLISADTYNIYASCDVKIPICLCTYMHTSLVMW